MVAATRNMWRAQARKLPGSTPAASLVGQGLQQRRVFSRGFLDRFEQPVAQRPDFWEVALVLRINQPEAVSIQGQMAKWLNQEPCFDRGLEHGRRQDRHPVACDRGM